MFYDAALTQGSSFNQPLNKWNVPNVTDMYSMFAVAKSDVLRMENQPRVSKGGVEFLEVSRVRTLS